MSCSARCVECSTYDKGSGCPAYKLVHKLVLVLVIEVSTRVFCCSTAEKHFFPDCTFEQVKIMKKK